MDSNKIKKGLGRGLSSLIGETKTDTNTNELSISDLVPNRYQPRKLFDDTISKSLKFVFFITSETFLVPFRTP